MLQIVKSFHKGMEAEVRVGALLSDYFEVRMILDISFSAVVASWRNNCEETGVDVLFRHGRKFVGDRTVKSKLNVMK